ncbi:uncharacterized protein LOC123004060 [Tribolium madens]|uniref:uncharacterized protein LOC123004060 n=1 Tax=Tribolium madens TaxID=41895 RepID=UPI001CF75AE4|nr:uncharacterized protein LOC123004060 [Tribolium madens]
MKLSIKQYDLMKDLVCSFQIIFFSTDGTKSNCHRHQITIFKGSTVTYKCMEVTIISHQLPLPNSGEQLIHPAVTYRGGRCLLPKRNLITKARSRGCTMKQRPPSILNIFAHENVLLIFERKFDSIRKLLKFALYRSKYDSGNKNFSYQIEIEGDNKLLSNFTSGYEQNYNFKAIKLASVISFTTMEVTGKLVIGEATQKYTQLEEEMLSLLKCINCSDYAISPIHYCAEKSNVVCSGCKENHGCDSCEKSAPKRNISLDGIASLLTYPCKYKRNGCTFTSKSEKISEHHSICELSDSPCPFEETTSKCLWKGTTNHLLDHIRNNHQRFLYATNTVFFRKLIAGTTAYMILKFSYRCFRFSYKKTEPSTYYFTVQTIGCFSNQYKFEIEIQDPSTKGIRLVASKLCPKMTKIKRCFTNPDNYIAFDNIKTFEMGSSLIFKVTVFK